HTLAIACPRDHLRQLVIILRADDEIDGLRAAHDLFSLGLRDAAGNRDQHLPAFTRRLFLHDADAADLGIDLLHRLLADVAGVEDDEVGVLRRGRLDITAWRQRVRHTMRIVDVHLAAEGFDVDLARLAHGERGLAPFGPEINGARPWWRGPAPAAFRAGFPPSGDGFPAPAPASSPCGSIPPRRERPRRTTRPRRARSCRSARGCAA